MNIEALYQIYSSNYLITTDTRDIKRDAIFFSLQGDHFNGNKFAEIAIQKGAKYAVIDDIHYQIKGKTILVNNVLETLQKLANYHRKQLKIPIIGITGSNGKTTTKELIHAVLKTQFNTGATKGNLNNHIGVPLTLLSFTNKTEIGIVEMGANHQKEIEFLSSICEPDVGYITNFGKAHLEGFGGIEGVIKGKSELYTYLKKNNKLVLIDADNVKQLELTNTMERISLDSSINISSTQPYISLNYKNQIIDTQLIGTYNLNNLKAAISIGEYYKVSEKNIIRGINNYTPTNNRSQVIEKKSNTIVMDAYNANPTSTRLALENFNEIDHKNKIVILGDMFELGEDTEHEHQNIVNLCDTLNLNRCIFVGKHYGKTSAEEKYLTVEYLKECITTTPLEKGYILIKGSRGMSLEQLLECIN
jgi:UDP-N-acetylmuramoyl-tripeptide--D-alanyl-D-alanine ligase